MEHSARDIKSNQGRIYMTIALNGNTVRWSEAFLKRFAGSGAKGLPPGLILGYAPSHDPAEFVVKAADNRLDAPAGIKGTGSLTVNAAEYNSQKMLNRKFALPHHRPGRLRQLPHRPASLVGSQDLSPPVRSTVFLGIVTLEIVAQVRDSHVEAQDVLRHWPSIPTRRAS